MSIGASRYRIALNVLTNVMNDGGFLNLALKDMPISLSDNDRRFVSALCYTTVEHAYYIDFVVEHYAKGRVNKWIRNILRLGVAQLIYMHTPNSAVCNESVKLCKEIGKSQLGGFVNGVLRSVCRAIDDASLPNVEGDIIERLSIMYSYPRFFVAEFMQRFGEAATKQYLSYSNIGTRVRVQYPYTANEFISYLNEHSLEYSRSEYVDDVFVLKDAGDITRSELFTDGKITVQGESSAITCTACGAADGMQLLDACAAPGGKSAYLSAIMHGTGSITACDVYEHRCELIKNTVKRLHADNVSVRIADSAEYDASMCEAFDIVLVDAPCSGFGVIGKPDIRIRRTESEIVDLSALQSKILANCARYVKKGGALVYSTCTVLRAENDMIIDRFLHDNKDFSCKGIEKHVNSNLADGIENGRLLLLPNIHGTDGFFVARLERD